MSTPNRFDIRQSETRILQDQLNGSAIAGMDVILSSINSEVTPILRLFANNTLVINVQNSVISNPSTLRNRSIAPINGSVPNFTSGSVTVPPSNGGNITTSTGGSTALNCPTGDFVKILISMDASGGLSTVCGIPQSTANAALVPAPPALQLPIGYLVVQNIGSVIQNIHNASVFQFSGATASASSSGGSIPAITYYDFTTTTLPVSGAYSPDGTPVVNGDSVLFSNLGSGNNEAYVVSGVGGTLTWTPLSVFGGSPSPSAGDLVILMNGTNFGRQILYFDGTTWDPRELDRLFANNSVYVDRTVFQQSLLASQTNANLTGLSGASNAVVSGYSVDYRLKSTGTNVAEFPTFYTNTSGGTTNPSIAPQEFMDIITQADGKYVVVGLTSASTPSVASIVRYNSTGMVDSSFQSTMGTGFAGSVTGGGTGGAVAVAQQPSDGSLVIGGSFTAFKGNTRQNLVRVALNGTEDTAFYTNLGTSFSAGGSPSQVQAVAVQPADGKILVGGQFSSFNGNSRQVIVRLNTDGTEDTTFSTNVQAIPLNGNCQSISVQTDGKLVLAGNVGVPGFPTIGLVRLNSNGTLDTAFETNIGSGFNGGETAGAVVQTDGKIVVAGRFTTFNGNGRGFIARLNSDGTEDSTFVTNSGTGFAGTALDGVSLQPNGQIAVVGSFTSYNGNGIADGIVGRLNADGTLDTVFATATNSGSNNSANAIVTPTNGLMVIAGLFTTFVGATRHGIAEILTDTITRIGTLQVAIAQDTIKATDVGTDSGPIASGITFNANLSGSTINVTYSTTTNAFTGVFDVETFY